MNREIVRQARSGYVMLVVLALAQMVTFFMLFQGVKAQSLTGCLFAALSILVVVVCWVGFFMVHP
ncbi:MAG: hypothetical protein RIA65_07495, partial [Woeseia sp.]